VKVKELGDLQEQIELRKRKDIEIYKCLHEYLFDMIEGRRRAFGVPGMKRGTDRPGTW